MTDESRILFLRVLAMVGLALVGFVWRKRGALSEESTRHLGRLVLEVSFPALTFVQLLRTVSIDRAAETLTIALAGLGVIVFAILAGALAGRVLAPLGLRATFTFLVGTPNWLFMPLSIAAALYGDDGIRTILLANVAMQLLLWTLHVALLQGSARTGAPLRGLLLNPGLIATALGLLVAMSVPGSGEWGRGSGSIDVAIQALELLGSLTVPLSLLLTGSALAAQAEASIAAPGRTVWMVCLMRLLVVPALTIPLLDRFVPGVSLEVRKTLALIAAMPVAVMCSLFVDRFGGDPGLAVRAIGYSTVASVVTVPILFAVFF